MAQPKLKILVFELERFVGAFCIYIRERYPEAEVIELPDKPKKHRYDDLANVQVPENAKDANILVTATVGLPVLCHKLPHLQWAHCTWAGCESLFYPKPAFETKPAYAVTRSGETFGRAMGEYVLQQILIWQRQFVQVQQWQKEKHWGVEDYAFYRLLSQLTIAIVGAGSIGQEVARLCKGTGMKVIAVVRSEVKFRSAEYVDEYKTTKDLPEVLQHADVVCCILPKTFETDGLMGGEMLKNCAPKKPLFINIGRGNIITEGEIIHAMRSQWISSAALDVVEKEPLPRTSKLWDEPNVVITPHISGINLPKDCANTFNDNLERFIKGEQLKYLIDWDLHY